MDIHSHKSSYREKLIEHIFIGELLKHAWLYKGADLEISRPEVDRAGYDVIAECSKLVRHIQMKTTKRGASGNTQTCGLQLGRKPSGCIVWIYFDANTLALGPFYYFGGNPGEALPDISGYKIAKHVRGNKDGVKPLRPDHRVIPRSAFQRFNVISDVYAALFGR